MTGGTDDQVHGNRDSEYLFKKRRKGGRSQGIAAQICEAAGQVCSGVFYAQRRFDRLDHLVMNTHAASIAKGAQLLILPFRDRFVRSEGRRVGKEWVSMRRYRWEP